MQRAQLTAQLLQLTHGIFTHFHNPTPHRKATWYGNRGLTVINILNERSEFWGLGSVKRLICGSDPFRK
jgi:hypothetical protein